MLQIFLMGYFICKYNCLHFIYNPDLITAILKTVEGVLYK